MMDAFYCTETICLILSSLGLSFLCFCACVCASPYYYLAHYACLDVSAECGSEFRWNA